MWAAFRNGAPTGLSHKQATALAGELYRAWADSESRARSIARQHTPGVGWERVDETQSEHDANCQSIIFEPNDVFDQRRWRINRPLLCDIGPSFVASGQQKALNMYAGFKLVSAVTIPRRK